MGRKLNLNIAKKIAENNGGRCLSTIYVGIETKMLWQCKNSHMWEATLNHTKNGSWCPKCSYIVRANNRKLENGLAVAKEISRKYNGECLSVKYTNNHTKMLWKCEKDHKWKATLHSIKDKNSWCKKCMIVGRKTKDDLKIVQQMAKDLGGKCLCIEYTNSKIRVGWECDKGHVWEASISNIKKGTWCPKCATIRVTKCQRLQGGIQQAQKIAKERGGICLSDEYINALTKMKWKCKKGHIWCAVLNNIKKGTWCPECGYLQAARKSNNSCILKHWKTNEEIVCVASYEKKTVEYLYNNKINFKWQHKTFNLTLKNGKQTTYRPDLYLVGKKNPWVEIK